MDQFTDEIQENAFTLWAFMPTLLYSVLAFVFFLFLGFIVASVVGKGIKTRHLSDTYATFFLKIIRWIFGTIGFLIALKILGFGGIAASILAGGGVTAIILGFAFRDIGENILAGFFLAFSRPFNVGDLIRSEGLEGRVQSVDLRHTHIRTGDGCDIFIPSSQIFSTPLHNFTRDGLRRIDFNIGIDYGDDTTHALRLLDETLKANDVLIKEPPHMIKIQEFTDNYVQLNVAFWINTFKQEMMMGVIKTQVMEQCRKVLLTEGFTVSSNVTTALEMNELDVKLKNMER